MSAGTSSLASGTPVKKDNGSHQEASPSVHTPEASSPPPSNTNPLYSQPLPCALSPRTRTRVAANKDAALARRHLRMAEQKTAESRGAEAGGGGPLGEVGWRVNKFRVQDVVCVRGKLLWVILGFGVCP